MNTITATLLQHVVWRPLAALMAREAVADWLIASAQRRPYQPITSADGQHIYMGRWWLFNPYQGEYGDHGYHPQPRHVPWLPSVRIHHICRADQDRDLHDHPWNARTVILRGWYEEERAAVLPPVADGLGTQDSGEARVVHYRVPGDTGRLLFGQYHRISRVSDGGVWTLFITGRKRGTWGFWVNGKKVPWRTYLGLDKQEGGAV